MDVKNMLKHIKFGQLLPPQLKDNGDFADNTYFDTQGLAAAMVLLNVGTLDIAIGSTAEDAAPFLEECDTVDGTYTAISGAALAAVIGATDDNKMYGISVDLTKTHKRYLRVNAPHSGDGTAGANLGIIALGFPADVLPKSASEMGLEEFIEA